MGYFNLHQYKELSKLLVYLKESNMYYKKVLLEYTCEDLSDYEKIKKIYSELPIITKNDILNSINEYYDPSVIKWFNDNDISIQEYLLNTTDLNKNHDKTINIDKVVFTVETTSGTTGKPFPIVKSPSERFIAAKYLLRCRKQHECTADITNGFLLAHEVDEYLKNTNYLDEKSDMKEVVEYFVNKRPVWVFVTANTLKRFVKAIESFGMQEEVRKIGIKFIEVTAAKLEKEEIDYFEELFNAPVRNQYGCREVWNIAYECKCGRMHVNNSNLMVDIVDENGKSVPSGKVGEVVVTSTYSKITPFIKYYLGDYASISLEECECGNKAPILTLQGGRKCEKLKNTPYFGTAVFRRVLRVLYFNKGLRYTKIKIVQDEDFHLSVYIEKCSDFDLFRKMFCNISAVMIGNFSDFKVDFYDKYPFEEEKCFLKENVFISMVS